MHCNKLYSLKRRKVRIMNSDTENGKEEIRKEENDKSVKLLNINVLKYVLYNIII